VPKGAPTKVSAGTLLYRRGEDGLEVLIIHPSGAYNRRAPWGIPKGLPDAGETDLELTARRETLEETGVAAGPLVPLGFIDYQKSRKRVFCFAGPAPPDVAPHTASWEIDRAEFVELGRARQMLHPDQSPFLDRLTAHLTSAETPP
jgi:predicted NUDIX family NTP pyrophosphohydrolase